MGRLLVAAAQVLLLWDRLLGYDSLELLPVLAAAVLVFRAGLIMQVLEHKQFNAESSLGGGCHYNGRVLRERLVSVRGEFDVCHVMSILSGI